MAKPERVVLEHVRVQCPLTGVMIGSKRIMPHTCNATLARNGSVHIYCIHHMFKGFISHPQVLEVWNVAKVRKESPAV